MQDVMAEVRELQAAHCAILYKEQNWLLSVRVWNRSQRWAQHWRVAGLGKV